MTESAHDYTARLIGLLGEQDPETVLARTPDRLAALVSNATSRELEWTSSSTRWSVVQILAHLADAEVVGAWRFRSVLAQDGVPVQGYDQNAWATAFDYAASDPAESLALFSTLRRSTLRVLRTVEPARIAHAGLHQERGRESVGQLVRLYAGHDLNHLAQIERLLDEARQVK